MPLRCTTLLENHHHHRSKGSWWALNSIQTLGISCHELHTTVNLIITYIKLIPNFSSYVLSFSLKVNRNIHIKVNLKFVIDPRKKALLLVIPTWTQSQIHQSIPQIIMEFFLLLLNTYAVISSSFFYSSLHLFLFFTLGQSFLSLLTLIGSTCWKQVTLMPHSAINSDGCM